MDYGAAGPLFVTLDGMDGVHADHSPPKKWAVLIHSYQPQTQRTSIFLGLTSRAV